MAAFVPSYWREQPQRYRYEGNRCTTCNKVFFPPRRTCDPWGDCQLEPCTMATDGKLLTWTVIRVAPQQFGDEVPYVLGVIEMADGARITAQVVDLGSEGPAVGMPVRIEFRKIQEDGAAGILMYGYKVVPASPG